MSSFGEDGRSIDAVNSISDYSRRLLTHDELEDIKYFKPLLNWWRQKYEEKRHIPSRSDFNPTAFQEILPNISIFEPIYKDEKLSDFITTLIGTELTKVYGEVTGELVTTFDNEYVVSTILNAGEECIKRREPLGITSQAISEELPFMRSFALYCPLASDHIHIDKLLIQVNFEKTV